LEFSENTSFNTLPSKSKGIGTSKMCRIVGVMSRIVALEMKFFFTGSPVIEKKPLWA
jgi:hypothetical protein